MRLFARLLRYFRPYLGRMAAAALMLSIAGALMSAVVATLKPLTDQVLAPALGAAAGGAGEGQRLLGRALAWVPDPAWREWLARRAFVAVPLLLVVIFLARALLLYFGQYLSTKAGVSIIRDLRAELFEAVVYQSQRFFEEQPTGLILSRVLNDVQRIQRVTTHVLADLVRVGAMLPLLVVVIFVHDWRVSLFSMVALPLLVYPMVRLGRRLRRATIRAQEATADAANLLTEAVQGSKVVQGFGMERFETGRFLRALQSIWRAEIKAGRAQALAPAAMELVGAIAGALLFIFAGYQIARGRLSAGDFVVVLSGLGLIFMSLRRLNTVNLEIQQALAAAARVFEMLDREREVRDAPDAVELPPFAREIRFERVTFAYGDRKVLDGIDLTIRKGEVVALVGASGSGKTTLAHLLLRFYDPTEGRITMDGYDLRRVTLASLRAQIGLVTQETMLFDDTVRANIAYGRSDAPPEKIVRAACAAHAQEFVERLPQGYDTVLGERGARLSLGQRQRLAIARALLKNPPILVLDEATSALDAESEALVQRALENLLQGRTAIVIAHRLSTVRRADRIVVLEAGRIVETGAHEELLARGGVYARLHELQFEAPSSRG